jgi:NADH-quinone oxidoreductase subunit L
MTVPLMVLALLAVVALVLGLPHGFGPVSELFQQYTAPVFAAGTDRLMSHEVGHFHAGAHPAWPYFAAWGIALVGTLIGWAMYGGGLMALPGKLAAALPRTYALMVDKFRVDELYDVVVVRPLKTTAYVLWRVIDVFVIDGIVNGSARAASLLGSVTRLTQNGDVQRYAAVMAIAAAAILWTVLGVGGL